VLQVELVLVKVLYATYLGGSGFQFYIRIDIAKELSNSDPVIRKKLIAILGNEAYLF